MRITVAQSESISRPNLFGLYHDRAKRGLYHAHKVRYITLQSRLYANIMNKVKNTHFRVFFALFSKTPLKKLLQVAKSPPRKVVLEKLEHLIIAYD